MCTKVDSLCFDHHIYADDTQLFTSFQPKTFTEHISRLQDALTSIAHCMTANLLCLNNSKTEFLLLGRSLTSVR